MFCFFLQLGSDSVGPPTKHFVNGGSVINSVEVQAQFERRRVSFQQHIVAHLVMCEAEGGFEKSSAATVLDEYSLEMARLLN